MICPSLKKKMRDPLMVKSLVQVTFFILGTCWLPGQNNVVMIVVDDLRPMLGSYGHKQIQTPNMDRLAASGALFTRAYCQVPQCGPSRVSVLTGLRPDTSKIHTLLQRYRPSNFPLVKTIPQYFKEKGYYSRGFGKVFHDGRDVPASWSVPLWAGRPTEMTEYVDEEATNSMPFEERKEVKTIVTKPRLESDFYQSPNVPDGTLFAGRMTSKVVDELENMGERPFFLAVGFRRPHLPLVAPKKYFDLYPENTIQLPPDMSPPSSAPIVAFFNSNKYYDKNWRTHLGLTDESTPDTISEALSYASSELRSYRGIPYPGVIPHESKVKVKQAYMACISYIDTQIGRIMDKLEQLKLVDNTIIALWSDHGWHLGEQGIFGKLTNYEMSARVPLIILDPSRRISSERNHQPVELLDLYPTLCELAGLEIPEHVEGRSLLDSDLSRGTVARTQYLRDGLMGRSIRDSRYRYVEWTNQSNSELVYQELYDYKEEPLEQTNLAHDSTKVSIMLDLKAQF